MPQFVLRVGLADGLLELECSWWREVAEHLASEMELAGVNDICCP